MGYNNFDGVAIPADVVLPVKEIERSVGIGEVFLDQTEDGNLLLVVLMFFG